MEPAPRGADGYVVHFDRRMTTDARVGDQTLRIDTGADGRRASYLAEVGKPLTLLVDPKQFSSGRVTKLEVEWGLRGSADRIGRAVVSDGDRDARTGELVTKPIDIELTDELAGTLDLSFISTSAGGRESRRWNPHYGIILVPKEGATLRFDDDWSARPEGVVQAGQRLQLAYDVDRMREMAGGDVDRLTAYVRFDDDEPLAMALSLDHADGGAGHDETFLPAVRVPFDARRVEVWFRGQGPGGEKWDSSFGENFSFDVAVARPDADPHWKRLLLDKPGFPKLTADNFRALSPPTQDYNCIAWTVGKRDEWLWPGTTVEAFDDLYARHGYEPLAGPDVTHDPAVDKIAIYGIRPASGGSSREPVVTHGAVMNDDGRWTSKMGNLPLIEHEDPTVVEGSSYGELLRVYARPRGSADV